MARQAGTTCRAPTMERGTRVETCTTKNSRLVDQPVVNGVKGEFEAVGDTELVEDVMEMVLDGLLGDEKFFADFLIAEALGDALDDFFFAVAEQRLVGARLGFAGFRESFRVFGGLRGLGPGFARCTR